MLQYGLDDEFGTQSRVIDVKTDLFNSWIIE